MQLTPAQRRFYIDPVQDPTSTRDRILVTEERAGRGIHLDTIVPVRKRRASSGNRHWWITESGDHVNGAPVNPQLNSTRRLIAPGGDGWFWLGSFGRSLNDSCILNTPRRSDGRQFPGAAAPASIEVPIAVLAAPWAEELFPEPEDSDTVVSAKVALAEQRWNHRRAKAEIIRQGMARGWTDDLATLRADGRLPESTFGIYYQGFAMISATATPDLSARDAERLEALSEAAGGGSGNEQRMTLIGTHVTVPLSIRVSDHDDVRNVSTTTLTEALRSATNDHSAVPGNHILIPVLRSVA